MLSEKPKLIWQRVIAVEGMYDVHYIKSAENLLD